MKNLLFFSLLSLSFCLLSDVMAGGMLTIAIDEEIEGTDPQQIYWYNLVHEAISEPLIRMDQQNINVVPALASSLKVSKDGKTMTFTIPDGLTFTNGDSLTAGEIKNSLERYRAISPYASDFAGIETISAPDKNTLVFRSKQPPAYIWPVLTNVSTGVMHAKLAKSMGAEAFNRKAVSFGPTFVKKWVQGSYIELNRNPHYRTNIPYVKNKGPIYFDQVKVIFIADAFTRVAEFMSGNIDVIMNIPEENVDEIKADSKYRVFEGYDAGVNWIMVNHRTGWLADQRVRRAIALAVDRREIKRLLMGNVKEIYGMLSPSQICYSKQGEKEFAGENAKDIKMAGRLLAEAGWTDSNGDGILEKKGKPLVIELSVPLDRSALKRTAPLLQMQLLKVGIDLKLREYETTYVKQLVRDHNYEMALRSYSWLDPSDLSYKFHTDSKIYSDPVLDKLLDEGLYIMDREKRAEKYIEVQKRIFSQSVAIPLFVQKLFHGTQKAVEGMRFDTTGTSAILNDVRRVE